MKQLPDAGRELPHKKGEQRRVSNTHNTRSNKNSQAMLTDGTAKQVKHKVKVNTKQAVKKPMTSENVAKSSVAMVSYPGTTQNNHEIQLSASAKPFVPSPPKLPRSAERAVYNIHRGWITNDESERVSALNLLQLAAEMTESMASPSKASASDPEEGPPLSPISVLNESVEGEFDANEFIEVTPKKKSPKKSKKKKKKTPNPSPSHVKADSTPTTGRKLYQALEEAAKKDVVIIDDSPQATNITTVPMALSPTKPRGKPTSPPPGDRKLNAEAVDDRDEAGALAQKSTVKHVSRTYERKDPDNMATTPLKPRVSLSPGQVVTMDLNTVSYTSDENFVPSTPEAGLTEMHFSPYKASDASEEEFEAQPNDVFQPVIAPETTLQDDEDDFTVLTDVSVDTVGAAIPQVLTPQRTNTATYRRTNRNQEDSEMQEVEEVSMPPFVTPETVRELPKITTTVPRKHYTFCDISIKLNPAIDAKKELFRAVGEVVRDMTELSPSLAFFPYTAEDRLEDKRCISDRKSWNSILGTKKWLPLQRYFRDATAYAEGGKTTVHVLIGSDKTFDEWYTKVNPLFRDKTANRLFKCQLQSEFPVTAGWLYRSHGSIDTNELQRETTKILGFPVGMKWRKIYSGRNGRALKDDMQAVHVEVEAHNVREDTAALRELFHAMRDEGFPLGIEMRFIADITQLNDNAEDEANAEILWIKQYEFIHTIVQHPCSTIMHLDKASAALEGSTLRDYLMALRWSKDCRVPLVLGVNRLFRTGKNSRGTKYAWIVTLVPQAAVEGRAVIKGLIPKLIYELHEDYHTEILSLFDPVERGQAKTNKWDPKTRTSTDPNSHQMAAVLKREKMRFDLTEMLKYQPFKEVEKKKEETEILGSISIGEDSIGTVGNPNGASKPRKRATKPPETTKTWQKTLAKNQEKTSESTEIPNGTTKAGKSSGDITTEDWANDDGNEDIDRETWDGIDDCSTDIVVEPEVPPPQPAPDEGPKGSTIRKDHVS
jgi:hypothetical protein